MKRKFIIAKLTALLIFILTSNTLTVFAVPNDLSLNEVIQNVQEYDNKIEKNMDKLNEYKEQILQKENDIKENEDELEKAQKNLEEKDSLLEERLKKVHMDGGFELTPMQYLDALFSSGNLVEAVEKVHVISQVCKSDRKLVLDAKESEKELNDIKNKIEKENEQLKKDKESIEKEIKDLEDQKNQLLKYVEENSALLMDGTSTIVPITLPSDITGQARTLIEETQKYLGIPYLWGGTTPDGFDCSGLMQYVFKSQNIDIPRVSEEQQSFAKPISMAEIKPGDLVFNKLSNSTHVGMYIGNDMFIHAPHTGDFVKISKLSTSNMKYVGRILDTDKN
ncbi:C40 family peptidase [Clostridium weizhouense]|uniref:C40 family peptidase n=1 Tax=Clostridium weizhouense TaxID=2859781 RepID=A0ABS7APS7_9CLOT|nr:C40 family peptidase [Clostridium weizhouense]MBW6410622.1 C40 family peptidase [Clostridium weizhouense]